MPKISQLPAAVNINNTDLLPIVQGGETKEIAFSDLLKGDGGIDSIWNNTKAPASFAANGYQKLPSGLIIQWGGGNNPAVTTVTHTLPIAFPNNCLRAFATGSSVSGDQAEVCIISYGSTAVSTRTDVTQNVFWLAIGY